jgi:hypothetical protein
MNAIEFSGKIEQGVIRLPKKYEAYNNLYIRVILLIDKEIMPVSKKEKLRTALQKMEKVAMFTNIENPTQWQKNLRDGWE